MISNERNPITPTRRRRFLAIVARMLGSLPVVLNPINIFDLLIQMVGETVARLVLPILSFGKIYVEPLDSLETRFNWLGYRRDDNGRIEISISIADGIGFAISLIALLVFGLLIRAVV